MIAQTRPSGRGGTRWISTAVLVVILGGAAPAWATKHLTVIQEVFVGPPGDGTNPGLTPDQRAQYVMIRMTSAGQNLVANTVVRVEDRDGNVLGSFGRFPANVANGGSACSYPNCPAIIMGTQAAKNLFSFAFDAIVDGQAGRVAIPAAGGRACFKDNASAQVYDCVAWGNFSCTPANCPGGPNTFHTGDINTPPAGNGCDSNFGTPIGTASGLTYGRSAARSAFNCAAKENSTQFALQFPRPVNNAGTSDNTDSDADTLINVLDCNDASTTLLWPPTEVQDQTVTGRPSSTDAWASQSGTSGSGIAYDEVRGTLANVKNFSDAGCSNPNNPSTSSVDPNLPPAGNGFYYLVRADGGPGCTGTYGTGRDASLSATCP